jgi:iron(III) transport system substrate-binding protein
LLVRSHRAITKVQAAILVLIVIGAIAGVGYYFLQPRREVKGVVNLYTSVPTATATAIIKDFQSAYPEAKVELFRSGSTEVMAKIWAEKEAGSIKADVLWLADASVYYKLIEQGLLLKYKSPEAENVPAAMKDSEGYWTGARLINMIIAYNTKLVKAPPTSWYDLQKFGKRACMPNPFYSGAAMVTVGAIANGWGWSFFEDMRKAGVMVVRGNSEAAAAVVAGEVDVGMTLDYIALGEKVKGAPIEIVWPKEGTFSIPSPVAILSTSKNVDAAKTFVDYVLSKRGQEFMVKENLMPVRPDVAGPSGLPNPKDLKTVSIPYKWIADNSEKILSEFERIMLK